MVSLRKTINLVGHPFAPIGMGEHVRCSYRSLRSVGLLPTVRDIYKLQPPDADELAEFSKAATEEFADINIFHINADEVKQAMAHITFHKPLTGYNIVYPAWELGRYPKEWATQLDQYDEIWAPSKFIKLSLEAECQRPVIHMPLACEVLLSSFLSRRYFEIPESDYVFLYFFDVRSYPHRKNPQAVIEAFRKLLSLKPFARARLVMKINGAQLVPKLMAELRESISDVMHSVTLLCDLMSDNETKNLVRCCDCFLSLHRSEGFGRGMAEAMYLGKPVIATAYSGNMDFTSADTTFLVPYNLISVVEGAYPHWQNQVWADPDVDVATAYMAKLLVDPQIGRILGARASRHIRTKFGYRATGIRCRHRLEQIAESQARQPNTENY